VAICAVHLSQIAYINRMLELLLPCIHESGCPLLLRDYRVAGIAIFRNHLPIRAHVVTIVTAETSAEIQVPDVVGMSLPIHLHLGKCRPLIDFLHFIDRIPDFKFLVFGQLWVFGP
jgi:hypothetical protein